MVTLAPAMRAELVLLVALLLATAGATRGDTTVLDMTDTNSWAFVGPKWSQKGEWVVAPAGPRAKDGNVAVYTKHAFAAPCNISMEFLHGGTWTSAALVIGARNLSEGYYLVDVPIEGQQYRTENTFVTISRANSASWREGLASGGFIGPVPEVSSTPNLKHKLRAEISEGAITLWLDRQPLGRHLLPGLATPAHVGLASYSMLGGGPIASFASVQVEGSMSPPQFDSTPQPLHSWEVSKSADGTALVTTAIGNAVTLADKSVLALNGANVLVRSTDNALSWSKLSSVDPKGQISGARLLLDPEDHSLSLIGVAKKTAVAGHAGSMVRVTSTDGGHSFGPMAIVGNISTEMWGPAAANVTITGFDTILPLRSAPGTVLLCGGAYPKMAVGSKKCLPDLSGTPPPAGCATTYLGVSETAGVPAVAVNFCMRSADSGKSFEGPVNLNGYAGVVGTTTAMLDKDVCEVAAAETADGEVLAMIRPCFAHSPWSWMTRSQDGGKSFAPLARGHFPNYANFNAFTRTQNGALVVCGRFPAVTCQFSGDGGFTWRAYTVDLSAGWCQGSLVEIQPNVLLWAYGGWGPGAGAGKELHAQMMRVSATGLEPLRYNNQTEI